MTATKIQSAALKDMLHEDNVIIIDVRESCEYRREHISKAKLYPLSSLNADTVLKDAGNGANICVMCAAGGRSAKACEAIASAMKKSPEQFGKVKLFDLVGGMSAWRLAGLPVEEDKRAPLPVIRQVHLIASTLIISGALLTRFYNPNFFVMPLFVGCGLFVSGSTGFCGMASVLQLLPYNRN